MFELRVDPEERQLVPFYGYPVCLLMKDGSRKVGRLTACRAGRITLNGPDGEAVQETMSRKKHSRRGKRPRSRKPAQAPAVNRPEVQAATGDDFLIGPLGMRPQYADSPPETVPLSKVESVLVL